MNLSILNIEKILHGKRFGNFDSTIDNISIDSRSLQNNKNTLFFALVGPNNDAHIYISSLLEKGVQNFVVTYIPDGLLNKATFFEVENTITALQLFAVYHRSLYTFPVIGLTGSNGKTIVKEWLNFLLSPDFNIIRSPKSYNSQVGVPLSVIAINQMHNLGIFEAGISTTHEMQNLEVIIKPSIGVLTTIGPAHDEGFRDREEKIREKLLLFKNAQQIIYQKNSAVDTVLSSLEMLDENKLFSWSFTDKTASVFVVKKETSDKTTIHIEAKSLRFDVEIPFQDDASVENVISCVLVLLSFEYDIETIQNRIRSLYSIEMRLKVKNGINSTTLIDDSYSSDYQSLKIALNFLDGQMRVPDDKERNTSLRKKTVILSDIIQSGLPDEELYTKVSELITSHKIDRVVGIGITISAFQHKFSNCTTFKSTAEFYDNFSALNFNNETILIKGARHFKFEQIVAMLEEKTHETVLEVNLNAISHNLNFYKSKLQPTTKMMVMVKAFGYGSGGFEIAKLLEYHKVHYLGVAFADEGIALKNAGITLPVMVLNPETTSFLAIISNKLEPEIYSFKGLNAFLKLAAQQHLEHFPIHIKLDTGMHRLGFEEKDMPELISALKNNSCVMIKSILSHMATSDATAHRDFAISQIELFDRLSSQLMTALQVSPIRHIANTSGISNFPTAQYDMVRLGIGLYGISNDEREQPFLENVGTLKSIISQIRTISEGDSVGYGRRFFAKKTTDIATIPIGYADGISRHWGNGEGFVTINSKKATIVGSICMDMLMVDVTDIKCKEGDCVIIFGESPTVSFIAVQLGTIPYEILTSISQRVKRIFYRE